MLPNTMDRTAVTCGVWLASSFTTSLVRLAPIYSGLILTSYADFLFHSDDEKRAVISLSNKTKAQQKVLDFDMPSLLGRLDPYKCGFLRQAAAPTPSGQRVFTMRELGRHIYPEVGMYCAIDGDVYDIGRKCPRWIL